MERTRLFIIGAPKCGTTSLARWLSEHSEIHMSRIKEPHFYNTDMSNRTITKRVDYDALFADAPPETKVLAEASTWYLYSNDAVPNILQEYPGAKFIVMTRDPVEMAVSLFFHNRFKMHEDRETLEEAWSLQARRARGDALPRGCKEPAFLQYTAACSLGTLLERLERRVLPARLLHIRLEAMRLDTPAVYRKILAFLEVSDDNRQSFAVHNEARRQRSVLLGRFLKFGTRLKASLGIKRETGLKGVNRAALTIKQVSAHELSTLCDAFAEQRARLATVPGVTENPDEKRP